MQKTLTDFASNKYLVECVVNDIINRRLVQIKVFFNNSKICNDQFFHFVCLNERFLLRSLSVQSENNKLYYFQLLQNVFELNKCLYGDVVKVVELINKLNTQLKMSPNLNYNEIKD